MGAKLLTKFGFLIIFDIGVVLNMDKKFIVGQEWNYETREGEENSTLKILKIDEIENTEKNIIHISISGLKIENPNNSAKYYKDLRHIPICEKTLKNSVTKVKNEKSELPDFNEGYSIWKEAYEKKEAGFFTISVLEIVKFMDKTINQGI